jgi:hypothetical protein
MLLPSAFARDGEAARGSSLEAGRSSLGPGEEELRGVLPSSISRSPTDTVVSADVGRGRGADDARPTTLILSGTCKHNTAAASLSDGPS